MVLFLHTSFLQRQETEQDDEHSVVNDDAKSEGLESQFVQSSSKGNCKEESFRREWKRKKTLHEVAVKQKEHLMDFYMSLNKRYWDSFLFCISPPITILYVK